MNTSNHLTTEQIYELLDHPALPISAHLQDCAECQQEVADLRSSLDGFRVATTGLAASQPLPRPRHAGEHRSAFAGMSFQVFAASCATALALIVTSLTLLVPHHPSAPAQPVTTASAARPASESDDALLNGIEEDLSAPVAPSMAPLQVAAPTSSTNQQK